MLKFIFEAYFLRTYVVASKYFQAILFLKQIQIAIQLIFKSKDLWHLHCSSTCNDNIALQKKRQKIFPKHRNCCMRFPSVIANTLFSHSRFTLFRLAPREAVW